ncbi:hypothetical protein ACGYQ5_14160 [Burkholderia pseudomallei]
MADEVDVKIRADATQANDAMTQFADAANDSTSQVKGALTSLGTRATETATRFRDALDEMSLSARERGAQIKESLESIEQKLNAVHKTFSLIAEVAVAGALGEWAIEQVRKIGEMGEALEHASQETGIAIDKLQEFIYAGQTVGISADQMQTAMGFLSRRIAEARGGSIQAEAAFRLLGISMRDLQSLSLDQVYQRIAKAMAEHANGAEKTALVMQVFGRNARELVPLLNEMGEHYGELAQRAHEVGAVTDTETVEAMARLGMHMNELKADIGAAASTFGGQLAGAFDLLVTSIDELITKSDALKLTFHLIGEVLKGFIVIVSGLIVGLYQLAEITFSVGEASWDALHGRFSKALEDVETHFHNAAKAGSDYIAQVQKIYGFGEHAPSEPKPPTQKFGVIPHGSGSARGEAAVQAAIAAARLAELKEQYAEEARANQDAYRAGNLDLAQYYAERLRIEQDGLKAEMGAKRAEFQATRAIKPQDANEALQLKAKLITINGQLAVLDQKYADSAIRNAREYALALREQNDQLTKIAAQKTFSLGTQTIAQEKAMLDERFALHQVSKKQEIASEVDLENQRFELQRAELEKEKAIAQQYALNKPAELAKVNAQIEESEAEHQTKMAELAAQGAEEQAKYQTESVQSVNEAFSTMFENIAEGHQTLRKTLMDFFNDIDRQISRIVAKSLTEKMFGPGTEGGGFFQSIMGRMFGGQGTAPPATTGASTTSLVGLGGSMSSNVSDWMKGAGLGASGQISAGQLTAATMTVATIPNATVANMTVANMVAPGGGGGGGGMGDAIGSLMGGSGGSNAYGFSLEGTGAEMSAADTAGGMALPAGLGGVGSGIAMYAQGTNYVPETQLAILHRGEAVVPSRYNRPTPAALNVTNNFALGQVTDLRTQSQVATLAAATIGRAARRNG